MAFLSYSHNLLNEHWFVSFKMMYFPIWRRPLHIRRENDKSNTTRKHITNSIVHTSLGMITWLLIMLWFICIGSVATDWHQTCYRLKIDRNWRCFTRNDAVSKVRVFPMTNSWMASQYRSMRNAWPHPCGISCFWFLSVV